MGVQVSRHLHSEISEEGNLRKSASIGWPDFAGPLQSEGDRFAGRARNARSCTPMLEHSAEVQRGIHDRIPEREERSKNSSRVVAGTANDRSAFLSNGILGKHSRP